MPPDREKAEALLQQGLAFGALKQDYSNAIPLFEQAIRADPTYHGGYNNLGLCLHLLGRLEQARTCFDRSLELSPNDPDTLGNRASVYADLGDLASASSDLERYIKVAKPDVWPEAPAIALALRLGLSARQLEAGTLARTVHEAADDPGFLQQLRLNWVMRGLTERVPVERLEQVEALIREFPGYIPLYNLRAEIQTKRGNFDRAFLDFAAVAQARPSEGAGYIGCAKVLDSAVNAIPTKSQEFKRLLADDILRMYRRGLKLGDGHGRPLPDYNRKWITLRLATWLRVLKRFDEAKEVCDQAIAMAPNDAEAWYQRGLARFGTEQVRGAVDDMAQAIRLDAALTDAYAMRALYHGALGELAQARDDMQVYVSRGDGSVVPREVAEKFLRAYSNPRDEDPQGKR